MARWKGSSLRPLGIVVVLALSLVGIVLTAVPGSATFAKKYDLVMSSTPSPISVGTSATITATFTNKSLYTIGKVTLAVPSSKYTVTSASTGLSTITGGGSGVSVTGLNLLLNKPYVITMTVAVACDAATGSWGSTARTSIGTSFTLNNPGNSQKTSVTGTCAAPPGPITIDVTDPVTSSPPTEVRFIAGVSPITLYASTPTGTPAPTVTWQYSADAGFASPTNLTTGSSLAFTPAQASDEGYYRAKADNGVGSATFSNVTRLVPSTVALEFSVPPTDAVQTQTITGTPGDETGSAVQVQLKVDGNISTALDGQGVTIAGAGSLTGNTAVLSGGAASFPTLSIATAGDYTLTASVDGGGPSTDGVAVKIGDGILDCGTTTDPVNGVTVERLANVDDPCVKIVYTLERDGNVLAFLKDLTTQTDAQFIVTVDSWDEEAPTVPLDWTQVDTPGPDHDIKWCQTTLPASPAAMLPTGEVTCLMDQSIAVQTSGNIKVSETYYLFGDILYKR
jgi:hypothetical protein